MALRQNETTRDVPVIVVTSKDLTREERKWLLGNAMKVFQKGAYERQELIETLSKMVEVTRQSADRSGAAAG
jgi:CheY-like chemotaxis protein